MKVICEKDVERDQAESIHEELVQDVSLSDKEMASETLGGVVGSEFFEEV